MRVGSLFTGYGGLDMAVGGDLAWYAEIEPAACKVLTHHHPDVPNLGDITEVDWSQVEPVDIITGGYPCQPFSTAGARKGKNDERHLWPYVRDAIHALQPRYAILENVSGHLTLGLADVLADLTQIGWDAEWGTYRASDIGAPHRRERIFIVAYPSRGARGARQGRDYQESEGATGLATHFGELATDTSVERRGEGAGFTAAERWTGTSDGGGPLTTHPGSNGHGEQLHAGGVGSVEGQTARSTQQREWSRGESDSGSVDDVADTKGNEQRESAELDGLRPELGNGVNAGSIRLERERQPASDTNNGHGQTIGAMSGLRRGHATRPDVRGLSEIDWGKYEPAIRRWEQLTRPAPDPTYQRAGKDRLNPGFVEWMMGLPAGHVTGHGVSAAKALKMLGNGVVPQQAAAAISQLMERTA